MAGHFFNVYEDSKRAESYAKLEFPGTYYLAYRDIPAVLSRHVNGKKAMDFGCGTGRSTRFLKKLGFEVTGSDISAKMINKAREFDPDGDYRLIKSGDLNTIGNDKFDLVFAGFTFDNIPDTEYRLILLKNIAKTLNPCGVIVLLCSAPEIYVNEWASFSTKDYPENRNAKGGDKVKIVIKDVDDKRPVEDIVWFDSDYVDLFNNAKLDLIEKLSPLGKEYEPYAWVNETEIAPWIIYVLK